MTIWQKIQALLTNSWMNSVQYLAAMAHIGWAALIVLSVAMFSDQSYVWTGIFSGVLIVLAACKEFLYDANYELPKQTSADNWEDFFGYVGGTALAWILLLIKALV
jgi:hypothetical protein